MDSQRVEFSYEELLHQNRSLSEELAQCQKDKDFVWSLWKNLQVEKPDVASVISSVVEREQMKSDAKDLKVLNILQQKDQQIKTLEEIGADLQIQLKQSSERLSELIIDETNWQSQLRNLEKEKQSFEALLQRVNDELAEKEEEAESLSAQIKVLEDERDDFHSFKNQQLEQIKELEKKLQECESEMINLQNQAGVEKKNHQELSGNLEADLEELRKELSEKIKEFDEIQENLEIRENQVKEHLQTIDDLNERIDQQELEIHSLSDQLKERPKLSKHISDQAQLIRNLEELQDETQKVLNKQQDAYQNDIGSYKKSADDMSKKITRLQKSCDKLMSDNKKLVQAINQKNRYVEELEATVKQLNEEKETRESCERCVELKEELQRCKMINKKQNIEENENSLKSNDDDQSDLRAQKEMLERLQNLVDSMEIELQTTRTAHKQRLERYKHLQETHHLVLEQLATYEDGSILSPKPKGKPIKRASHKSLRHEESEKVWNELEYYKKEYGKYKKERSKLLEDLDEMKVKVAQDGTVINNLKLQLTELKQAIDRKNQEIEEVQDKAITSKTIAQERQLEIWKEKLSNKQTELEELEQKYLCNLQNEHERQQEITRLTSRVLELENILNRPKIDTGVQTSLQENTSSEELIEKVNKVLEFVTHDKEHLTLSQLESTLTSSVQQFTKEKPTKMISTQTTPRKPRFYPDTEITDQSTQTEASEMATSEDDNETSEVVNSRSDKLKRKQRLANDTQRLLVMRSEISLENRSLKKRILSLETQVSQLRESRNALSKEFDLIQNEKEKLQSELVGTLQKLQTTRNILQDRTQELEKCSEDLKDFVQKEKEDKETSVNAANELKTLKARLKEVTKDNSQSTVKLSTLEHENVLLTQNLKQSQDKVTKLEKTVNQKKNYIDELKDKLNETKSKLESGENNKETVEKKVRILQEREQKNKTYIEQLKKKVDCLSKEKMEVKDNLDCLHSELTKKSRLLEESQRLCRNAESAISEMELTAYEQLKSQHEGMTGKNEVIRSRYDKTVAKVNELRVAVVNFSESLLSQIHDNRSKLIAKKRESVARKQDGLLSGEAFQLACSILNMTTDDLEDFLRDEEIVGEGVGTFEENGIRQKLDLILQKEKNFGKVLTRFLMDLVQYNHKLCQEIASSA